jgi:hypothetical protein
MSRFGSIVGNGKEKGNRRKVKLMLIPCKTPLLAFENHHTQTSHLKNAVTADGFLLNR